MINFYNDLSSREKKLVISTLVLLFILSFSLLLNSIFSDLRNIKRIHNSVEADYLYVLQKANIISNNVLSQNINLSGVSIYDFVSTNEKLKFLDLDMLKLQNINGSERLTFDIERLDLLTPTINEFSLFFNKNPSDIKVVRSNSSSYQIIINF
jgi:hypothetical protein